jgi:HlyD family secretion protein
VQRKILLVLIAAIALGTAGAAGWYFTKHRAVSTDTLTLYGNVDIRQVQLAFNGSERVATMVVREGDQVRKGQLLATLDTTRLESNVKLQQAQLASQQQQVARLEAGSRPEEILKAQDDVEAARIAADNASLTYLRQKDLVA